MRQPLIFGGVLEEGADPHDRGNFPVPGTQQSGGHPPSPTPSNGPAEQRLPRPYRSTLSQVRSGYGPRLQSYRHSVGWADDPTGPGCHSTEHTVAPLFICPSHPTDLAPGGYVGATPPDSSFPGRAPTLQRSASTADRLWTSFLPNPHPLCCFLCIPDLRGGIWGSTANH